VAVRRESTENTTDVVFPVASVAVKVCGPTIIEGIVAVQLNDPDALVGTEVQILPPVQAIVTVDEPAQFVPVNVTEVPTTPDVGETFSVRGRTVNVTLAALEEASVAVNLYAAGVTEGM